MSKPFILTVCAGFALILALQLRTSQDLQPDPIVGSSLSQRRLSSSYNDPRTVVLKDLSSPSRPGSTTQPHFLTPLTVCERAAPILADVDMHIIRKYAACPLLNEPPENTTLLLIEGMNTFGRTGNNLIEFLHSLQYGKDNNVLVGIMQGSWPTQLITGMWMAIQDDDIAWRALLEKAFCIKMFHSDEAKEPNRYKKVIRIKTKELFKYKRRGSLNQYIEFQGHILRTLYRFYNTGTGVNMRRKPVGDMCSVMDALFGEQKRYAMYSVIHSRSLEGEPGLRLLGRIAGKAGCDPVAALNMEPEYVKAILAPLGMLGHPIVFLTDGQRPEILEKLMADPEIGPNIRVVPEEASWVGGDITAAVMSNVFIGNPASSFSGFIAKTRMALGYRTNFMFRRKERNGEWVDSCDQQGIFDKMVMSSMA